VCRGAAMRGVAGTQKIVTGARIGMLHLGNSKFCE
jgi:hypothetical protein